MAELGPPAYNRAAPRIDSAGTPVIFSTSSGEYFGWSYGWAAAGTVGFLYTTVLIAILYVSFIFSFTELTAAIPHAGGPFAYARRAFGPFGGLVAGYATLVEFVLAPPAIAAALGMDLRPTESFLVRVSRMGLLARVAENRFFPPAGLRQHAAFVEELAAGNHGSVTGGKLRDRAGIGRALAIEILEYFDRIKFTRRAGDEHHLLRPAREVFGDSAESHSI